MPTAPPVLPDDLAATLPDPTFDLPRFLEGVATQGDVVSFTHGGRKRVLINDAAFVARFLQEAGDETRDAPINESTAAVTGDGLLSSTEPRWRPRRLLVQRQLSHRKVREHLDVFADSTTAWLAGLTDGRAVDLHAQLTGLTLDNLGDTVFAADFRPLRELLSRVMTGVLSVAAAANAGLDDEGVRAALHSDVARVDELIATMTSERENANIVGTDVLSVLVAAARQQDDTFNTRWARDEALTLIVAGHDTTSLLTTLALSLLARHPHVREVLRGELRAARAEGTPQSNLCEEVPLVRHVLAETLRLYPPVPVLHRLATQDVTVQGHTVPAGTLLVFSPWVQHRDPRHFADPQAFDPWRFSDQRRAEVGPAYIPFGAGRRICAGNHFATLQSAMILTLVTLLADIETSPQEPALTYAVALRLRDGLPARLRPVVERQDAP